MNVAYEYADGRLLIYENYPFTAYGLHGFDNGNVFYHGWNVGVEYMW